ncbi:membrane protein insertase YidC [Blochmannia endosymbiont of Colobopsis nipponica]|uniref:membrane protein insertase YidC n=1 Tax=Blochmannia endosymbiont of Colobopsis nipponica TaxID=2681987 RepID=UPI00177EA95A|nr:membrane protein insertase YidC [Blochmannia endosymbiont of Colobopsis nipponica]QOI10834.1 membrane protein insertase YidC [Blochmannia endosymbiont of Colobopsis nipponica]
MDYQRNFFIIALLTVTFIMWQTWQTEHNLKYNNESIDHTTNNNISQEQFTGQTDNNQTNKIIKLRNDVLSLEINTRGGNIENAYLLNYLETLNTKKPFTLLTTSKEYVYQNEIIVNNVTDENWMEITKKPIVYKTIQNKDDYVLDDNQEELQLPLYYIDQDGVIYTKIYILKRGSYAIQINYNINNTTKKLLKTNLSGKLTQSIKCPKEYDENRNFFLSTYRGAAYYLNKNKYKKYSFKEMKNKNLYIETKEEEGWVAILQQYFIVAMLPYTKNNIFYTKYLDDKAIIGFTSSKFEIKPQQQKTLRTTLWVGPKIQEKMAFVNHHLELTIDYGWLWFISQPLFKLLQFIHDYVGNWGISIVIITLIIRIIMYPLTKSQYTSMAKMRILQPKLMSIQKQFKNNKQRFHQEMISLYKKEKVNPLGGCLPLLIQMPIFLALYYMLSGSVELRHAKFIFWIHDLSSQDPYYILPIVMGATMFLIQKTSPTTMTDPIQQKIMNYMLIIFTIFFLWFPSGLVLYYVISNMITIIQQKIINNELKRKSLILK